MKVSIIKILGLVNVVVLIVMLMLSFSTNKKLNKVEKELGNVERFNVAINNGQ